MGEKMATVLKCQVENEADERCLVVIIGGHASSSSGQFVVVLTRKCHRNVKGCWWCEVAGKDVKECWHSDVTGMDVDECWNCDVTGESVRIRAQCRPGEVHIKDWTLEMYERTSGGNPGRYQHHVDLTPQLIQQYDLAKLDGLLRGLSLARTPKAVDDFSSSSSSTSAPMQVTLERSTYKSATIRWELTGGVVVNLISKWSIILRNVSSQPTQSPAMSEQLIKSSAKLGRLWYAASDARHLHIKTLAPGESYEVELYCLSETPDGCRQGMGKTLQFRAELTKEDLDILHTKALSIESYTKLPEPVIPCRWLYRHKPHEYYEDIERNHGGVMKVYTKDSNGDPASCINGQLDGLFFSANVYFNTRTPMDLSTFGSRRFLISCKKMFQVTSNLYFADVSCTVTSVHTVTLVSTRPGSAADRFCAEKLLPLNPMNNPFLYVKDNQAYVSTRNMIEILYTEDIDIRQCIADAEFDAKMETCQRPTIKERHGGRPKQRHCQKCNVVPENVFHTDGTEDSD